LQSYSDFKGGNFFGAQCSITFNGIDLYLTCVQSHRNRTAVGTYRLQLGRQNAKVDRLGIFSSRHLPTRPEADLRSKASSAT